MPCNTLKSSFCKELLRKTIVKNRGVFTFRFSDVFRGYRKATPGCNGLIKPNMKFVFNNLQTKTVYKIVACKNKTTWNKT